MMLNYSNETLLQSSNGTASEIFLMSFIVPVSSLFWMIPCCLANHSRSYIKGTAEAVFINLILLFAFTIWSDYIPILLCTLIGGVLATALIAEMLHDTSIIASEVNEKLCDKPRHGERASVFDATASLTGHHIPFLTDYRGHMLLATAISILSVDFQLFPHRFAKTEMYGWSVMDAGVGCFVAVHGICSPYAKSVNVSRQSVWKSFRSSFLLLILGFVRLAAVKTINYNVHVSEYGIHWNFFFTLATTKILGSVLLSSLCFFRSGFLAVGCVIIHQCVLSFCNVAEFILSNQRENFLQANKEGICSILGFVVIYLLGIEIGKVLQKPRSTLCEWLWVLIFLVVFGTTGWIVMCVLHSRVQQTSRKMANMAYCVWVIALTSLQLAIHLVQQLISVLFHQRIRHKVQKIITSLKDSSGHSMMQSSVQWKAINLNGLVYFLLANLLTGLVNISMDTNKASTGMSLFILTSYVLTLTAMILLLLRFSLRVF